MIECLTHETIAAPHGFFTRKGGTSVGPFYSLNCGLNGIDDPRAVAENRARAVRSLDADPSALVGVTQVHGREVVTVTEARSAQHRPEADSLVTDLPGIVLGVITADCAPVLLADPTGSIVGAAHAGWRGALAGIAEATVAAMRTLGAREITAVIGPCIQQSSYEVTADLRNAVLDESSESHRFFKQQSDTHWLFDLPAYVSGRLDRSGITSIILPHDTYTDEARFFSYRRRTKQGIRHGGHQISMIRTAS